MDGLVYIICGAVVVGLAVLYFVEYAMPETYIKWHQNYRNKRVRFAIGIEDIASGHMQHLVVGKRDLDTYRAGQNEGKYRVHIWKTKEK